MITIIPGGITNEYFGPSTEDKPSVHVPNGSTFYEFDTVKLYVYDADLNEWIEQEFDNGGSGGDVPAATAMLKDTDVTVYKEDWEEDPDGVSAAFPYRAPVELAGVTEDMFSTVVFGVDDACSGNFAPVAKSDDDAVYIYAAEVPENDLTILSVVAW